MLQPGTDITKEAMPGVARKAVKWKFRVDAAPDWKQGFIFHECDVEYLFLNKARLS